MTIEVDNIVLFIGDAVRFDKSKEHLASLGKTYKTTAASLHTPASIPSILTGLNVPEHGVTSFSRVLSSDVDSLLDLEGFNTYFSGKTGTMHEDMHRIFQMSEQSALADTQEPFIWVVRDPGGHAPYDGYDPETYNQSSETAPEYLERVAGSEQKIEDDYETAVNNSINRFQQTIDVIESRGLSENTLIIYTSDHGELLGEYGLLGHNHVACPELVYVPTTFVHPDLDPGISTCLARNVDIFGTCIESLGLLERYGKRSGISLWSSSASIGYNHFEMVFYNSGILSDISLKVKSCWDESGGHVFVESSLTESMLVYLGLLAKSHKGKQMIRSRTLKKPFDMLLPGHSVVGDPAFDKREADEYMENIKRKASFAHSTELDEETRERLDDLGYV